MLASAIVAAFLSWGPSSAPPADTIVIETAATGNAIVAPCHNGLPTWLPGTLQVGDPTRASDRPGPSPQHQRAPSTGDCALV